MTTGQRRRLPSFCWSQIHGQRYLYGDVCSWALFGHAASRLRCPLIGCKTDLAHGRIGAFLFAPLVAPFG